MSAPHFGNILEPFLTTTLGALLGFAGSYWLMTYTRYCEVMDQASGKFIRFFNNYITNPGATVAPTTTWAFFFSDEQVRLALQGQGKSVKVLARIAVEMEEIFERAEVENLTAPNQELQFWLDVSRALGERMKGWLEQISREPFRTEDMVHHLVTRKARKDGKDETVV